MSDMRPKGIPVMLDGVERHILFSLNVIDNIQDQFDLSLEEVIDQLTDKRKSNQTLKLLLKTLLEDEIERKEYAREEHGLKRYTEKELGWLISQENVAEVMLAVLRAYGVSLPELEDDYPNQGGGTVSR